jgi:outer membrane lipoprotein-sorting protein
VKILRTLPTRRLLALVAAVAAAGIVAGVIAVTAFGGSGATPPPKPLAQALHDALAAPHPAGITARITFTNHLFPSGALLGQAGSALMSGATGRLWVTADGRGRLELQSDAGDAQIVWGPNELTVYDASSNTVYRATLPEKATSGAANTSEQPPSLDQISTWLTNLGEHAALSGAQPDNVARQPAYTVTISPKHDGGLLGSAELAWDAAQGVPLRAAIYAQGSSTPVLALTATDISYGPVASSDVEVSPPSGAKVVDLGGTGPDHGGSGAPSASGLDAVQAAVSFQLVAPDSLVGLPRKTVQLLDSGDSKGALIVYGQGLGAIVLVERPADSTSGRSQLDALPKVSIGGVTGHELATQLGTAIEFQRAGVSFILAGSLPPSAAEAAARALG